MWGHIKKKRGSRNRGNQGMPIYQLFELSTFREEFTNPATGDFFKEGDEIKRKKFAKTLTEIGESGSADILYNGTMGEKIVKEIQELGGIITMEDLNNFE